MFVAVFAVAFVVMGSFSGCASARSSKDVAAKSSEPQGKGTILFVPHDDRPTSREQSAEAVEKLGYTVLMPPKEMLGGIEAGKPDELWQWAASQAVRADAAVVSTDSIIYGGLVASRKHELSEEELAERVGRIESLKKLNPKMKVYAFGSLMRTPSSVMSSCSPSLAVAWVHSSMRLASSRRPTKPVLVSREILTATVS